MTSGPCIVIPKYIGKNVKYGFLSIESQHEFEIEGKVWPTVEHFLLAKKFEGTTLEDAIRRCPTVGEARILSRPRSIVVEEDGHIEKRIRYGPDLTLVERGDWSIVKDTLLRKAIEQKYEQNPKLMRKLLATEGIDLVDEDPFIQDTELSYESLKDTSMIVRGVARITSKIRREKLRALRRPAVPVFTISNPNADLEKSSLTLEERRLVEYLAGLPSIESKRAFLETKLIPELYSTIRGWISSMRWDVIASSQPKFEELIYNVKTLLGFSNTATHPLPGVGAGVGGERVTEGSAKERLCFALELAAIIRWMRLDAKLDMRITFYEGLPSPSDSVTTKGKSTKSDLSKYIDTILYDFRGIIDLIVYSKKNDRAKVLLSGNSLLEYIPSSKNTKDGYLEIERKTLDSVFGAAFVFIHSGVRTNGTKKQFLYNAWLTRRLGYIFDRLDMLGVSGESMEKIEPVFNFSFEHVEIESEISLARKIVASVFPKRKVAVESLFEKFPLSLKGNITDSFSESLRNLDIANHWISPELKVDPPSFFDSLDYILSQTNKKRNTTELKWASGLLLSPSERRGLLKCFENSSSTEGGRAEEYITQRYHKDSLDTLRGLCTIYVFVEGLRGVSDDLKISLSIFTPRTRQEPETQHIGDISDATAEAAPEPPKVREVVVTHSGKIDEYHPPADGWICVVANSTSITLPPGKKVTKSEAVTRSVYHKYPGANIYTMPERNGAYRLGDVIVSVPDQHSYGAMRDGDRPRIASLIAEYSSGRPKKNTDTKDSRREWFEKSLERLSSIVKNGTKRPLVVFDVETLVNDYRELVEAFAEKHSIEVEIIVPDSSQAEESSRSTVTVEEVD
jgi:predicted NAD-dependent protein-ADP-ribosyltransferase YbiA (DUF1768 family)